MPGHSPFNKISSVLIVVLVGSLMIVQSQSLTPTPSAYGDLLDTEIRGLSAEDIEGYRTGAGLGFALPAELNGYPGPRHLLDLADELELSADQITEIQQLYDEMLPEAIELGELLLQAEADIEQAFRDNEITEMH